MQPLYKWLTTAYTTSHADVEKEYKQETSQPTKNQIWETISKETQKSCPGILYLNGEGFR